MSLLKTYTEKEKEELAKHKLTNDRHSQASDAFVLGMRSRNSEIDELKETILLTYSSVRKDYKQCTLDSGLNWSVFSSMIQSIQEGD